MAELGTLKRRMKRLQISSWKIHLRLFEEAMLLIWVCRVQIPLENLVLPSSDRAIKSRTTNRLSNRVNPRYRLSSPLGSPPP